MSTEKKAAFDDKLELPKKWGWLLALGILNLILGGIGFGAVTAFTLASVIMFAGFLMATGVLQIVQGIRAKEHDWAGRGLHFLVGILYIGVALLAAYDPYAASAGLTIFIAAMFVVIGVSRIVYAVRARRQNWKWLWPVLAGIVDLAAGGIIMFTWPASSLWVLGLLLSVELIMNGWLLTATALAARALERTGKNGSGDTPAENPSS